MTAVVISALDVKRRLESGDSVRLLDVRWQLGGSPGREAYRGGHLPTAVFVDLDAELAAPPTRDLGRHPLPSVDDLQSAARRWGLRATDTVVVYDDTGGLSAARAWWLLRWAGMTEVFLLDGGLGAWRRIGGSLDTDDVTPEPGDVVLGAGQLATLTPDEVSDWARQGRVVDARAGERYRGEVEPVDAVAGHIPGALSAPTAENLRPDGTFRDAGELAERFAALGLAPGDPVGVYCGSGVTAAHEAVALAIAGYAAALYPGSWSQWSGLPGRAVATGADRG